ncbi:MAG: hypothetical protein L0215_22245 [Gemmataceae bacterium]|nr:hypothetical protein [Gemmataceae bacterium]
MPSENEVTILERVIGSGESVLPAAVAEMVLRWKYPEKDQKRMHNFLTKAKAGSLTPSERKAAESYERVGHFWR